MSLVADLVAPLLIILVVAAPFTLREALPRSPWPFWFRALLGVAAVYILMLTDLWLHLWDRFGLDYSTHTALAVSLSVSLVALSRRWLLFLVPLLLLYAWLMIALDYHSAADIMTTAIVVGPITWLFHHAGLQRPAAA